MHATCNPQKVWFGWTDLHKREKDTKGRFPLLSYSKYFFSCS